MNKFHYFQTIKDIRGNFANSPSYRVEKLTQLMNIDKDVWIKYYAFDNIDNTVIDINGAEKYIGTPSVMLFVSNKSKSYKVYTYDGTLRLRRVTENRIRQNIIVNLNDIVVQFQKYLHNNKRKK